MAAAVAGALGSPSAAGAATGDLFGLTTSGEALRLSPVAPGTTSERVTIGGLQSGELPVAIAAGAVDARTFVLGSTGRLYVLDLLTGGTRQAGSYSLSGSYFGMTVTGRSAVTASDTGQSLNIRLLPSYDAISSALAYASGDPGYGGTPHVTAVAYGDTTLYGIDTNAGKLVTIDPRAGVHTVGALGVTTTDPSALAIEPDGRAYLATRPSASGASMLYGVNTATGAATLIGTVGSGVVLRGLEAIPPPTLRVLVASPFGLPLGIFAVGYQTSVDLARVGDPDPRVTAEYGTTPYVGAGTSAISGTDYAPISGTAVFGPGINTVNLPVTALDPDRLPSQTTTQTYLILSNPTGGAQVDAGNNYAMAFVDSQPEIDPTTLTATRTSGAATIAVTRPPGQSAQATQYSTGGGTGQAGVDYTAVAGTLSFADGETRKTFTVPVARGVHDGNQTIGIAVGGDSGTLTIADSAAATHPQPLQISLRVDPFRSRTRTLPVAFTCTVACRGHLRLATTTSPARARRSTMPPERLLTSTAVTAPATRPTTANIRVGRHTLARFLRDPRLRLIVTLDVGDDAGERVTARRTVGLVVGRG